VPRADSSRGTKALAAGARLVPLNGSWEGRLVAEPNGTRGRRLGQSALGDGILQKETRTRFTLVLSDFPQKCRTWLTRQPSSRDKLSISSPEQAGRAVRKDVKKLYESLRSAWLSGSPAAEFGRPSLATLAFKRIKMLAGRQGWPRIQVGHQCRVPIRAFASIDS
jgi:hypothetical protein